MHSQGKSRRIGLSLMQLNFAEQNTEKEVASTIVITISLWCMDKMAGENDVGFSGRFDIG